MFHKRMELNSLKNPNLNSDIVYQSGKFMQTELMEINGLWAKVSFIINGEKKLDGYKEKTNVLILGLLVLLKRIKILCTTPYISNCGFVSCGHRRSRVKVSSFYYL